MTTKRGTTPSLLTIARRSLTGECALPRGTTLLVAVSGGPDSMALLDVAARLAPKLGIGLFAHGVDHGLRPEAPAELDLASSHAARLDVPFDRTRIHVPRGSNLQARARAARWEALDAAARRVKAHAIATAHHADDRAETFFLRLLRGAGPQGLAVLPPRAPSPLGAAATPASPGVIRPLLRARRRDVLAHLERHAIPFARDPSNADPHYLRTRVRLELMPLLEALGPGIVGHVEALADQLAEPDARERDPVRSLPRATRRALAAALSSTSARVWLPSGLVLSVEPAREHEARGRAPRPPRATRGRAG
jgi:tRNA(Ile)-lysidine synthase